MPHLESATCGLVSGLMIPAQQEHLVRETDLERHDVEGDLTRELPPVHVIPEEDILLPRGLKQQGSERQHRPECVRYTGVRASTSHMKNETKRTDGPRGILLSLPRGKLASQLAS